MAKANNMDVSLSSGMANVSIPLHDLKIGKHAIPISLNYSANGLKPDEIPSRAGMGWTLNAGGVVTRVVHGKPDEKSTRTAPPPPGSPLSQWIYYYDQLSSTANNTYDYEPDVYMVSAPGLSGKFIIDHNGNAVPIPYNNYKINVISTSSPYSLKVNITDVSGAIYYFGDNNTFEKTVTHNLQGKYVVHQSVITAMFLTKIAYPDGSYVTFNYSPISYRTISGISQSLAGTYLISQDQPCRCTGSLPENQCPGIGSTPFQTTVTDIVYDSYRLTNIQTSDSRSIFFSYNPRPDNSGDLRFGSMSVNDGMFSRQYHFVYEDPNQPLTPYGHEMGTYNKRFFLKEIFWIAPVNETVFDTIRHSFTYESLNQLPPRLGTSQDHLGYYNAKSNATLIPSTPNSDSVNWGTQYAVADRTPDPNAAKKGMLVRVTYPTGGFQELEYEGHQYSEYKQLNSASETRTVSVSGVTNQQGQYEPVIYYSQTFNILQNQNCNLFFQVYANPGCTGNCDPPPPNTVTLAKIEIRNLTNGQLSFSQIAREWGTSNFSVALSAGNIYRLEVTAWGLPNAATGELRFDPAAGPVWGWVNYTAPGLRVKKITSFDPVSSKSTHRHFIYKNSPNDVQSSATYLLQPDYIALSRQKVMCQSDLDPQAAAACHNAQGISGYQIVNCRSISLLSNTTMVNFTFDDNHLLYNSVIETDDPGLANGYTQHKYWVTPLVNSTIVLGYKHHSIPASTTTNLNAYEKETNYYNSAGLLVKKTLNHYNYGPPSGTGIVSALAARKRYEHFLTNNDPNFMYDPYDVTQYDWTSYWIKLDSTINMDYDYSGNVTYTLKSKTTFYYGAPSNTQPIRTDAISSINGEVITTEMTYPTDYNSEPYLTMVNKNIISPVIETRQKRGPAGNQTDISLMRTNYKLWHNSPGSVVIEPEYITARKGSSAEEIRIRYHAYDHAGNPTEVSKENGVRFSYIWDYNKNFPIAEFKNASGMNGEVAYTSFEADGKGNWVFSGAPAVEPNCPTGIYAYALSAGSVSFGTNSALSYYVTYWSKDASGSVSVNGSTPKLLVSRNGWSCYEHKLVNPSNVVIGGTAIVDELRLYPVGAYVTTFTYSPFIGISSRNEPNNQILYYEYDASGRLKRLRNGDRNIVKQFEYRYRQQILPCPNNAPNWTYTTNWRCVKTSDHTNNNTGNRENEERDLNNCSPTYLQLRWVNVGNSSSCPVVPNCTGPDKRVVNYVCETGAKMLVNSYQTGPNSWICTYRYVWSDGFAGPTFTESSSTGCGGQD